jgi:hypothetical protein
VNVLAFRAALWREWHDHARLTILLVVLFSVIAYELGAASGRHALPHAAFLVGIVAPFACVALPASVVDDNGNGLGRLVSTQPLVRGAYAALRIVATTVVLFAMLAPLVVALSFSDGVPLATALLATGLCVAWSASGAILLGLAFRGPAAATGVWVLLCVFNLLAVLATWPGMNMVDILVRARHALPGAASVETLLPAADPWRWGAPLLLAIETLLLASAAVAHERHRCVALALAPALAVALPFAFPGGGGS